MAPERPTPKPAAAAPAPPRKRGRPKRGEVRAPAPPRRLALQPTRTLAENLAGLPSRCAACGVPVGEFIARLNTSGAGMDSTARPRRRSPRRMDGQGRLTD